MSLENTGTPNTDTGTGEGAAATPANPEFMGSLPEGLQSNEAFYGLNGVEDLANVYAETSGKVSEYEAQVAELEGKVPVVPPSAGEYQVQAPEGYPTEGMEGFLEKAFETGMTTDQVNAVLAFDHERTQTQMQQMLDAEGQGIGTLKTEWGDSFDANAKMAADAVTKFGGDELKQFLNESRLGNHPLMVKMFHRIATAISEDSLLTGNTNTAPSDRPVGPDGKPRLRFPSMKE